MKLLYEPSIADNMSLCIVQTHRTYSTKSEPQGRRRTLGDDGVSRQVPHLSQVSHLVGMVITGEVVRVGGAGVDGESPHSSPFCCEPKTALKNKVFKKFF